MRIDDTNKPSFFSNFASSVNRQVAKLDRKVNEFAAGLIHVKESSRRTGPSQSLQPRSVVESGRTDQSNRISSIQIGAHRGVGHRPKANQYTSARSAAPKTGHYVSARSPNDGYTSLPFTGEFGDSVSDENGVRHYQEIPERPEPELNDARDTDGNIVGRSGGYQSAPTDKSGYQELTLSRSGYDTVPPNTTYDTASSSLRSPYGKISSDRKRELTNHYANSPTDQYADFSELVEKGIIDAGTGDPPAEPKAGQIGQGYDNVPSKE